MSRVHNCGDKGDLHLTERPPMDCESRQPSAWETEAMTSPGPCAFEWTPASHPVLTTNLMPDTGIRLLLTYRCNQPNNGTALGSSQPPRRTPVGTELILGRVTKN